jgi:hypothetical protein
MFGPNDLPANYQPEAVSNGSLRAMDIGALVMICVMALGPLAVTAYQNPYTGAVSATPNLPGAK